MDNMIIKEKFMRGECVHSTADMVELICDDGEGILNIWRSIDGDIHFFFFGHSRESVRVRMSGSSIKSEKKNEIDRTLYYLMALLEDAYEPRVKEYMEKLVIERQLDKRK